MRSNKKGVTLVELMITVSVILLALVPLLRLFINANRGNQHLAQMTVAENIIQQTFDEISRLKWDENCEFTGDHKTGTTPPLGTDTPETPNDKTTFDDMDDYATIDDIPRYISGDIIPGYEAYRISVKVVYVENPSSGPPTENLAAPTDFKKVTVRISWKGGGANSATVKTKTRIFYNGVDYTR
ncbi:MAG: hypothetical protein CVU78_04725 [Elusimicrobia bacterium HGW-Elusimicrobia-2]|nr:MAG: hypothetical protein CVU78_04725 [Elusimicrobia bacterium HGW-Elusimicrobia-2]